VAPIFPFARLATVEVFAVEDTSAQLTWRGLPEGQLSVRVGSNQSAPLIQLGSAHRPGAADIHDLPPGTTTPIDVLIDGRIITQRNVTTLQTLDDRLLSKVATISDLHLGEDGFGLLKPMRESSKVAQPYAMRCAKAAVREAQDWGAELLVIKGDITDEGRAGEWEMFDELLAEVTIPVMAVPGNHDTVNERHSVDPTEALQARGLFPSPVHAVDIAGARIVAAHSAVSGHSWGRLQRWKNELVDAVRHEEPTLLFTHHHLEQQPFPWFWPLGVQRFDNYRLLEKLVATNPDLLISSGHSHRNRTRRHGSAVLSEVSATKDYPGVWAGYAIHESGVRQVVRRIADTSCAGWNDRTHAAVGGIWGMWSPGRLSDRCFDHRWTLDRTTTLVAPEASLVN